MRKAFASFLGIAVLVLTVGVSPAWAATLTSMSDTLSDTTANQTGVTHTVAFTTATTDLLKRITFQFSTTSGGSTKPAGLDLTSATLGTVSNLGAGWSISLTGASLGRIIIDRTTAATVNSSSAASVQLQNITNSAIDDCDPTSDTLTDLCYVTITTYSDDGSTVVDSGTTTYSVREDPQLSFEIQNVPSGETHNGVTTSVDSDTTSMAFGHLRSGTPRFAAQKLIISTNAPHGYSVKAFLTAPITGSYGTDDIDPFGAINATWSTPQTWSSPTGTTANSNTGWFGANTDDTRVTGWTGGSGKFGPISQIPKIVAYSSGPDRSGTTVYVSYGIEVNGLQPSDYYTANIEYSVEPIF